MSKLNQIIAIEKGIKGQRNADFTKIHQLSSKPDNFNGLTRVYKPIKDDGEILPPETKNVSFSVADNILLAKKAMNDLFNITARKDFTNCYAKADVKIDGEVILKDVPVTYLLFLEKQLVDIRTFIAELPTLDVNEKWSWDDNSSLYKTTETQTQRTKKETVPLVLYPHSEQHPAQTKDITKDITVGYWHNTKTSSAIPLKERQVYFDNVDKLIIAVKEAREEANNINEVENVPNAGSTILNFIFVDVPKN